MSQTTQVHTCIISREVLLWMSQHPGVDSLDPLGIPKERLLGLKTIVPLHTMANGHLCQLVEVTLTDE